MKILLVDDLAMNRLTLGALLEDDGHSVTEAESCAQTRERLSAAHFDVVLLDLGLLDGDGATLIPLIREQPGTRLVLASGSDVGALAAQADGVLRKGESYAVLQALLATFR